MEYLHPQFDLQGHRKEIHFVPIDLRFDAGQRKYVVFNLVAVALLKGSEESMVNEIHHRLI